MLQEAPTLTFAMTNNTSSTIESVLFGANLVTTSFPPSQNVPLTPSTGSWKLTAINIPGSQVTISVTGYGAIMPIYTYGTLVLSTEMIAIVSAINAYQSDFVATYNIGLAQIDLVGVTAINGTITATSVPVGGTTFSQSPMTGGTTGIAVTITPSFGVSYEQVLRDTNKNPFTIGMVRMQSTNTSQVTQGINIVKTDIYGQVYTDTVSMISAVSEYQYNNEIARANMDFDITGNNYISFFILPNTSVNCTVYVKKRFEGDRALLGLNPLQYYSNEQSGVKPLMLK